MPDTDRHSGRLPPASWNEAFAALPLEAPDEAQRARIARMLQARAGVRLGTPRGPRVPWWLGGALAAGVVLATVIVWPPRPPLPGEQMAARDIDRTLSPLGSDASRGAPPRGGRSSAQRDEGSHAATLPAEGRIASTSSAADAGAARVKPDVRQAIPTTKTSIARMQPTPMPAATETPAAASPSDSDALVRLQRESAQLEALVMLARNDRVTSAPAAVMASELDARIATIDASLTDPQLGEAARRQLWQQRVEALRELAGLEGTQRWLAANGESYDGALVSVD